MRIHTYLPGIRLQPFIKNFLIIESDNGVVNKILPDTAVVMAFRFRGQVQHNIHNGSGAIAATCISGMRKTARLISYTPDTATLIVTFRSAGAAAFFKTPLHEFFEQSIPLDALVSRQQLNGITEQLSAAAGHPQRIRIIERWLLTGVQTYEPDPRIQAAVQQLTLQNIKIKDLSYRLNISQDVLEKRFRQQIGATPKQFANIVRLRKLITQYTPNQTLTAQAYDAGYFDQAHFIKDFKAFTGQAPQDFFKSPAFC